MLLADWYFKSACFSPRQAGCMIYDLYFTVYWLEALAMLSNWSRFLSSTKCGWLIHCILFEHKPPMRLARNYRSHDAMVCFMVCWLLSLVKTFEPRHDKINKMAVRQAKTQTGLSTWRKLGSLPTHWAHSKDSDQTGRIPLSQVDSFVLQMVTKQIMRSRPQGVP